MTRRPAHDDPVNRYFLAASGSCYERGQIWPMAVNERRSWWPLLPDGTGIRFRLPPVKQCGGFPHCGDFGVVYDGQSSA